MKINFKEIILIPNLISLFRLLLSIPFTVFLVKISEPNSQYFLLMLIGIAFLSDISDGYIARKTNKISEFGKIIDPLADKTLVILIITFLFLSGNISAIYFLIIILRDLIIFIGGLVLSNKIGRVLPSNILGKITVVSIGVVIILTILKYDSKNTFYNIFYYLSICLCAASLVGYAIRAIEVVKLGKK